MPGCRKFDAASLPPTLPRRVELQRYVRHVRRGPRPANDNRRNLAPSTWYWAVIVGAMPTLGLLVALSALL
ncbi:hypothetical protein [Methylobacterium aerolatum]|uniref:DUF5808 domain-containing protein n=1 Tax=Methylobacterium aerolatum TaxID=418708 RepID=A0ABU0I2S1_9HYPH|nr:hypothetical protein [Methylobacterium aerolatum]MDQ0448897.1 hypothetical protein [Methylobacterium aerolatum]GJD34261.1 hypothetical protein FMGBMHLM_1159 [Methylobacterium aerolatum]